ncbi:hypothetical protein D3C71_1167830 [compost metagenome]
MRSVEKKARRSPEVRRSGERWRHHREGGAGGTINELSSVRPLGLLSEHIGSELVAGNATFPLYKEDPVRGNLTPLQHSCRGHAKPTRQLASAPGAAYCFLQCFEIVAHAHL